MLEIGLLACGAMIMQDVIGVGYVQATARNHKWLSAHLDNLTYYTLIATSTITVTAFQGHSLEKKIVVVLFVTVGNYIGTISGNMLGKRFIKEE